jgi:hypothetical protein
MPDLKSKGFQDIGTSPIWNICIFQMHVVILASLIPDLNLMRKLIKFTEILFPPPLNINHYVPNRSYIS